MREIRELPYEVGHSAHHGGDDGDEGDVAAQRVAGEGRLQAHSHRGIEGRGWNHVYQTKNQTDHSLH